MSDFQRFAIYYLPDDPSLAAFGASWLGWDVEKGTARPQPSVPDIEEITATPRKYGFHGTLKPPFRLADGTDAGSLKHDLNAFASATAPIGIDGLSLSRIGKFLALTPDGDASALAQLAFACVRVFDSYRKPADAAELDKRRAAGLTPRQENLLAKWGYPYVAEEFRFHLTLTGKLTPAVQVAAQDALRDLLPALRRPEAINSIALVGEREDGHFQLIHRYALTG